MTKRTSLQLICLWLALATVFAARDEYVKLLTGISSLLEDVKMEMVGLTEERKFLQEIARDTLSSGYIDKELKRSMNEVTSRMIEVSAKFDSTLAKITTIERRLLSHRIDGDSEVLGSLRRIEEKLQTPKCEGGQGSGGVPIQTFHNIMRSTTNQLEKNLEVKLRDLVNAQQKLMQDLFDGFSRNVGEIQRPGQMHVVSGDGMPRLVNEVLAKGLDTFTDKMSQTMDRKLHEFLSSVESLCRSRESPFQAANYSRIPDSKGTLTTRQSSSSHEVHKQYQPMRIDIVSPPEKKRAGRFRQGVKLPVQSDYWVKKPRDCAEIYQIGYHQSGIYDAYVENLRKTLAVYCDMETDGGGWTLIQRRDEKMIPYENFYRPWGQYKKGFGNLEGEFWLGNQPIYSLTNRGPTKLRVEIVDRKGIPGHAIYDNFHIMNEMNNYQLRFGRFGGGSLEDEFSSHNGSYFSTPEEDNDRHPGRNCAETYYSGWWYDNCFRVNLNGIHVNPPDSKAIQGVYWGFQYPGNDEMRLRASEMKVRPSWFTPG